jgi:hypothetical protein
MFITQGGQPIEALDVRVQFIQPSRDKRGAPLVGEDAESGLYVNAGGDIDREGEWWSLADITLPDGTTRRAAFDWDIRADAAIIQSRSPGVMNVLALAGVLGAVGWVVYPSARRLYKQLDLNPATVTVAVGAIIGTIVLTGFGFVLIDSSQAQYNATLNPTPQVVNTVLPDEASLERGRALFTAACPGWSGKPDLNQLSDARTRDDTLFAAVRDGWRGLSACEVLTNIQRWDVVNFIRTLDP